MMHLAPTKWEASVPLGSLTRISTISVPGSHPTLVLTLPTRLPQRESFARAGGQVPAAPSPLVLAAWIHRPNVAH